MAVWLLFALHSLVRSSPFCDSSTCECESSFNFKNSSCLTSCPTGYSEFSSFCKKTSTTRLATLNFFEYWDFSEAKVSTFSLQPNNFESETNTLPVPTKDRGFYFKSTSELPNTKPNIYSPDFTIRMTIKVTSDGVILRSETNGTQHFAIFVNDSQLCLNVLMSQLVDNATLNFTGSAGSSGSGRVLKDINGFRESRIKRQKVQENHEFSRSSFEASESNLDKRSDHRLLKERHLSDETLSNFTQNQSNLMDSGTNQTSSNSTTSTTNSINDTNTSNSSDNTTSSSTDSSSSNSSDLSSNSTVSPDNSTTSSNTSDTPTDSSNTTTPSNSSNNTTSSSDNSTNVNQTVSNSTANKTWTTLKFNNSLCAPLTLGYWYILIISTNISYLDYSISIRYYNRSGFSLSQISTRITKIFPSLEFLEQSSSELTTVGSSKSSFAGFLYQLVLDNQIEQMYGVYADLISCGFPYYFDYTNKTCEKCSQTDPGILCTFEKGYCYSDLCTKCTGFSYSHCKQCSNDQPDPGCGNSWFSQRDCSLVKYKSMCVYPVSEYINDTSLPAINIKFQSFEQFYGKIFQSGTNNETWAPFANPEIDDPIPAKSRGLYFNESQYLRSIKPLSLNTDFSIGIWYRTEKNGVLWSSNKVKVLSSKIARVCLYNGFDEYCVMTTNATLSGDWSFVIYTVEFDEVLTLTKISRVESAMVYLEDQVEGYSYYNAPEIVTIGQDAYGNFKGFIYQVLVWNSHSFDSVSVFNSFCVSGNAGCVWQTTLAYYYNSFINKLLLCDSQCEKGCSWWGTCNICNDARCDHCEDYNTCNGNLNLNCDTGLVMRDDGKCCNVECKECFEKFFFSCKACFDGFYLMGSVCAKECPLGFQALNGKCEPKMKKIINSVFGNLENITVDNVSQIKFLSVQDFPNFSNSSVIPASKRGVYFRSTSFITSEEFLMFYKFTIILYIKIISPGVIMQKQQSLLKLSAGQMNYLTHSNSFIYGPLATYQNMWKKLAFTSDSNLEGLFTSNFFFNYVTLTVTKSSFINLDSTSSLILGNASNSFTGFLYSISIYNSTTDYLSFEPDPTVCIDSSQLSCLSDCSFLNRHSGSSCLPCPECQNGCHSASFCNLCGSDFCVSCKVVAGKCLKCAEGFVLVNDTCVCRSHEFLNMGKRCEKCDFNCKECINNSTFCVKCGDFARLENSTCRCSESFIENWVLNDYLQCICPNHSDLVNQTCVCRKGFTRIGPSCVPCHSTCTTCKDITYADCLTCPQVFDLGVCLPGCALGYDSVQGICVKRQGLVKMFELTFSSKKLPQNDSLSGLPVSYKSGSRRRLESTPSSVLFRGVYFNGVSESLEFPEPPLTVPVLNYNFSISLWVYLLKVDNSLISQSLNNEISFALTSQNSFLILDSGFSSSPVKVKSETQVKIDEWSNLILSLFFQGSTTGKLAINQKQVAQATLSSLPFVEKIGSSFKFGEGLSANFKGFLFALTMFNTIPDFQVVTEGIIFCGQEEPNSNCLSLCPFHQFYDKNDQSCYDCLQECQDGCRNNVTCSQCQDPFCIQCVDFFGDCLICKDLYQLVDGKCKICEDNSQFLNNSCVPCQSGTYGKGGICYNCENGKFYNGSSCVSCQNLCSTCNSYEKCTSCIPNAYLTELFQCECRQGYNSSNFCEKSLTFFYAIASVSFQNEITLKFSEDLSGPLQITDVQLGSKSLNFSILTRSSNLFILTIIYLEAIPENSKLEIFFNETLSSVSNSSISPSSITVELYSTKPDRVSNLIQSARDLATTGLTAGLSVALGTSLLSFDPTSFFSFISTAETFYPISLFSCDLPEELKVFLASVRVQKTMPNFFTLFLNEKDGNEISQELKDLGFDSSLILINTGVNLSIGVFFLIFLASLKFCSRFEKVKPYVKNLKKKFEYGIFIRFWVQSYLELFMGGFITLVFSGFNNPVLAFDWFVGLVVMVRLKQTVNFLGIVLLLYLVIRRKKVEDEGLERFFIAYGVIFDEFKSHGISFWIFYLLFVLRRLVVVIFAMFVDEGIIQLMAISSFSVCVLFYVAFTKCFKNFISNFYVVVNEIVYLVCVGFLFRHLISSPDDTFENVSRVVTAAWALNIFYGVSLFFHTFCKRFFKKKAAKVANLEEITVVEKIKDNSGYFKDIFNPNNSVKDFEKTND